MAKVSVIIPSRYEPFLQKTVEDLLAKATDDIEIIAVLDGYWPEPFPPDDPRLVILHTPHHGMRESIRLAASIAKGEYLMKCDAHCLFDEGYDQKLKDNCDDNWIVIPRRFTLDTTTWQPRPATPEKPFVDYEYFIYPRKYNPLSLHGFRWDSRTLKRTNVPIDDTLTFQGSCWFMNKDHFFRHNFMSDPGYMGSPKQEAEELGLTTWMNGGRVVANKNVWYAHMHKKHAGYPVDREKTDQCYRYSYKHWVTERKDKFIELIYKFWPLPSWPENWESRL